LECKKKKNIYIYIIKKKKKKEEREKKECTWSGGGWIYRGERGRSEVGKAVVVDRWREKVEFGIPGGSCVPGRNSKSKV
jgi:hypothetical protein